MNLLKVIAAGILALTFAACTPVVEEEVVIIEAEPVHTGKF